MMPIYEYKCRTCGKEFELTQRITEDAIKKCPADICTNEKKGEGIVERKISKNIGFVFNGKGFYLTDYVHKNTSAANGSSASSKSVSETKTESKSTTTETKSEAKKTVKETTTSDSK